MIGQLQVKAKLLGKEALPWEQESFASISGELTELMEPIQMLLHRDPAKRMKVAEFSRICYRLCKQGRL
jgi:hypothetical protein